MSSRHIRGPERRTPQGMPQYWDKSGAPRWERQPLALSRQRWRQARLRATPLPLQIHELGVMKIKSTQAIGLAGMRTVDEAEQGK